MNKNRFALAVAGLVLAPLFSQVQAQVDQSNYSRDVYMSSGRDDNGQTFTPSFAASRGAGISLYDYTGQGASGTLFVQLRTSYGGTVLASGSQAFTLGANQTAMVTAYWAPVSVTPSTLYYLSFMTDESNTLTNGTYLADYYSGGGLWYYGSDYTAYGYDFTFEEIGSEVAAVPEPASVVLLATGLLGVFGVARRRNKTVA